MHAKRNNSGAAKPDGAPSRRLRDTALKVVAGSRDSRRTRTVSHVPGGAIGQTCLSDLIEETFAPLRSIRQRFLDGCINDRCFTLEPVRALSSDHFNIGDGRYHASNVNTNENILYDSTHTRARKCEALLKKKRKGE